ncbi:indole-3-glycerol phosphate synthase TrpC [Desulfosarcina sp. OttesenSCG-928-A07]|nr:indole-3-glycerol phosphate synthase TrpC [Desulfosarcina sp. OttesenSCG-928-A07]
MLPERKSSILGKILEHKKVRVESAKKTMPASALEEALSQRPALRNFAGGLHREKDQKAAIIAEIKRKSPSKGVLSPNLDAAKTAKNYENGGAAALSILTEADFFNGCTADLVKARNATDLPVLRKDFIFSSYQVLESAVLGADAILLIARMLDPGLLKDLAATAEALGMAVLHEINHADEIPAVLAANPKIIGINNRDLASFDTDVSHAPRLFQKLPDTVLPVALSGISTPDDIQMTRKQGIHSFLVGEALVKSSDPACFLEKLASAGGAL